MFWSSFIEIMNVSERTSTTSYRFFSSRVNVLYLSLEKKHNTVAYYNVHEQLVDMYPPINLMIKLHTYPPILFLLPNFQSIET